MKPLKIIFAGTPAFALPSLQALHAAGHQVVCVLTQPDRPSGRGQQLQPSVIKQWAMEHHLHIEQPLSLKNQAAAEMINSFSPDLMVVVAYGLILPQTILTIPRLGCVNVHGSLLPRWRGAAPIQYALRKGDPETGITIMQMDAGMDTGAMLNKQHLAIDMADNAQTLFEKLSQLAPPLLLETIAQLDQGKIVAQVQDESLATYAPKIDKAEGHINWNSSAEEIINQFRGLYPWPGAFSFYQDKMIKIHAMYKISEDSSALPGTVLEHQSDAIIVACKRGKIALTQWQWPNEKMMQVNTWLLHKARQMPQGAILK